MSLPELVRRRATRELKAFCERRDAGVDREKMRLEYEFRADAVTLIERRVPWRPARDGEPWTRTPIAKFRYDLEAARWTLFWPDSNTRWHVDDGIRPASTGADGREP